MANTEQGDLADRLIAVMPTQPVEVHWPAEIDWVDGAKLRSYAGGFWLCETVTRSIDGSWSITDSGSGYYEQPPWFGPVMFDY